MSPNNPGDGFEVIIPTEASIVDQHIDRQSPLLNVLEEGLGRSRDAQIERDHKMLDAVSRLEFRRELLKPIGLTGHQYQSRPICGEAARQTFADPS